MANAAPRPARPETPPSIIAVTFNGVGRFIKLICVSWALSLLIISIVAGIGGYASTYMLYMHALGWTVASLGQEPHWAMSVLNYVPSTLPQHLPIFVEQILPASQFLHAAAWTVFIHLQKAWDLLLIDTVLIGLKGYVLALSVHIVVLLAGLAMIDGLVLREIRRFGVASESSDRYRVYKQFARRVLELGLYGFLIAPWPGHARWYVVGLCLANVYPLRQRIRYYKKYI